MSKADTHQDILDNPSIPRNEFIDIDTGEDLYELLQGKIISGQSEIKKLNQNHFFDNKEMFEDRLDEEVDMNWDYSGLWFSEGLKYFLSLGKGFKVYFFGSKSPKCLYEFIPTDDMNIFTLKEYLEKESYEPKITYEELFDTCDGINLSEPDCKYYGCFWNLKPGFKANLLYKCVETECIDKPNDIWRFYFKKNTDPEKNLVFSH